MKKLFALLLCFGLAFGTVSSFANEGGIESVSYTHLTLPTILRV